MISNMTVDVTNVTFPYLLNLISGRLKYDTMTVDSSFLYIAWSYMSGFDLHNWLRRKFYKFRQLLAQYFKHETCHASFISIFLTFLMKYNPLAQQPIEGKCL